MPIIDSGNCPASSIVTRMPQSPPCAPNLRYPRTSVISRCHSRAVVTGPTGLPFGLEENPKPGREGTTTSKSALSGPMASEELKHGAGPAVRQNQRHGVRTAAAHMIKVNVVVFHPRQELRIAVQVGFGFAPVEFGRPVFRQRTHVVPVDAVAPVRRVDAVGQAGFAHAVENALDGGLRNLHAERPRLRRLLCLRHKRQSDRNAKYITPGWHSEAPWLWPGRNPSRAHRARPAACFSDSALPGIRANRRRRRYRDTRPPRYKAR